MTSTKEVEYLSMYDLFHRAWTNARDSPDYDKAIWLELQNRLFPRSIHKSTPFEDDNTK